jgi:hypothetical protein
MYYVEPGMTKGSIGRAFTAVARVLGWSTLGAVVGVLLGLANGVIHAPSEAPGDPQANEWYTLGVILVVVVECVAGILVGAGIAAGAQDRSCRREAFSFALVGAVGGMGIGWPMVRIFHVVLID